MPFDGNSNNGGGGGRSPKPKDVVLAMLEMGTELSDALGINFHDVALELILDLSTKLVVEESLYKMINKCDSMEEIKKELDKGISKEILFSSLHGWVMELAREISCEVPDFSKVLVNRVKKDPHKYIQRKQ